MAQSNRVRNSSLNVIANTMLYIIQIVFSFVVRYFFVRKLGTDLLGLDSLILNILTVLSLTELGISNAISFHLFKPLSENNSKSVSKYMGFYKKLYNRIGIIALLIGLFIMLFLRGIVGNYNYKYLYFIYFLYLLNTVSLYFISYKDVLIEADQKKYKVFKFQAFFNILMYVLEIVALLFTSNYLLYIFSFILCKILNRVVINIYISKYYSNIMFNSTDKLEKNEVASIKKRIGGVFFYKVGDYILNCTDNIIISSFINIATVGIYTNYLSISMMTRSLIRNAFSGITASFGNLSASANKNAQRNVFEIIYFLLFIFSGYIMVCLLNLFNPFINIWLGEKYLLSFSSMVIICVNFYIACNQIPLDTVKEATGFYIKDKYVPIIQAFINVVLSIALCIKFGLNGVIVSTAISYILTVFWNKPYMLYKYIFEFSSKKYFIDQIIYIFIIIGTYLITNFVINSIGLKLSVMSLVVNGIICSVIYLLIIIILFYRKKEFKFLLNYLNNIFTKVA